MVKRGRPTLLPAPLHEPPSQTRLGAHTGPTAIVASSWGDPDDERPTARSQRQIRGHRAYCPLRYILRRHGEQSAITERHIWAADRLRVAADLACLGATGARDERSVLAIAYGPLTGPSLTALKQTRALRDFRRAMGLFTLDDRRLVTMVILLNYSVVKWCAWEHKGVSAEARKLEMRRLVHCLDRLEAHYAAEIDDDVARGRVIAA